MRKTTFIVAISLLTAFAFPRSPLCSNAFAEVTPQQTVTSPSAKETAAPADNESAVYQHSKTTEGEHFKLTVSWDDPVAGQPLTLHCVGNGGTSNYKFYLRTPKYTDPSLGWEYVCDPTKSKYTNAADFYDFEFKPMATGTYELRIDCMNMDGSGFDPISVTVVLSINDSAYPSVSSRVQNAVSQCNRETDGSDYQKAVWLHDWLLDQLEYDNTFIYSSAESALCRGTGTCQAYMAAYQRLLDAAGIENREVRDEGDYHTWSAIKIDGEWCQVDCTWNDTDYSWQSIDMRHFYFGLTDELMATAHPNFPDVYNQDGYETPSKSLKNGYYVRSGEAVIWADAYVDRIQSHLDKGETVFSIATDNPTWPDSYKGIYNGYVAYELNQRTWSNEKETATLNVEAQGDALVCTATYHAKEEIKPGWNTVNGCLEYRDASGTRLVNRWLFDSGYWFYFDENGFALKGLHVIANKGYFFKSNCRMATGWVKDAEGFWYYAEASGSLAKGWRKLGNSWYWLSPSTYQMITGWLHDGNAWYWLESSGAMKTGWILDNGKWYYLGASGAMKTGWLSLGGYWYWLESSGAMATGWRYIGSSWYYLQPSSGRMATGWLKLNGTWYYLSPSSGAMATGWQKINGTWYYFNSSGAMH